MTRPATWSRRQILQTGAGLALFCTAARAAEQTLFPLGVASGFPSSASVVLWTRLARQPFAPDGGLGLAPIEVRWVLAADDAFRRVVASGSTFARIESVHSVHIEPSGLEPGRDYWYRFEALGQRSPIGRTRTAAAPGAALASLRAAVVSCQHFEHGE